MADTPRTPVFQRLKGWQASELDPQSQVSAPNVNLFPPPPGQAAFPSPWRKTTSLPGYIGQLATALIQPIPSTDIPRSPNFQRYRDYNRTASTNAQWWVWQTPPNIPPIPSTDVPRGAVSQIYRQWNRASAANAQFWVQSGVRVFIPPWFQVFTG